MEQQPSIEDQRHNEWIAFRKICFVMVATPDLWVWSAAQQCELSATALELALVPDFAVETVAQGVLIHAYDARHLVPWAQISSRSMFELREFLASVQQNALNERQRRLTDALAQTSPVGDASQELPAQLH